MRCPGRGRKLYFFRCQNLSLHLEMRCPGRGRKRNTSNFFIKSAFVFGNEMPRKGTETGQMFLQIPGFPDLEMRCPGRGRKPRFSTVNLPNFYLEMRCPGRGRKPRRSSIFTIFFIWLFGNEMPRKGTETPRTYPS